MTYFETGPLAVPLQIDDTDLAELEGDEAQASVLLGPARPAPVLEAVPLTSDHRPDLEVHFRQKGLEALNARLQQQGTNDRALRPVVRPAQTLGAAVALVDLSTPPPLHPSVDTYQAWAAHPDRLTDELHAAHCAGGSIVTLGPDRSAQDHPCPRCQRDDRAATLRAQLEASGVAGRYLDSEWSGLTLLAPLDRVAQASKRIDRIIARGANLMLYSDETGTGKTQAAMLLAKDAIRAGYTAHVTNMARLAVQVRHGFGRTGEDVLSEKQALARLVTPDLLVIDDLAAGEGDRAAIERRLLFLALDERQMHRRPTIVTTNVAPMDLAQVFGRRILARLQPLTLIHVDHGRNFRDEVLEEELW